MGTGENGYESQFGYAADLADRLEPHDDIDERAGTDGVVMAARH